MQAFGSDDPHRLVVQCTLTTCTDGSVAGRQTEMAVHDCCAVAVAAHWLLDGWAAYVHMTFAYAVRRRT